MRAQVCVRVASGPAAAAAGAGEMRRKTHEECLAVNERTALARIGSNSSDYSIDACCSHRAFALLSTLSTRYFNSFKPHHRTQIILLFVTLRLQRTRPVFASRDFFFALVASSSFHRRVTSHSNVPVGMQCVGW